MDDAFQADAFQLNAFQIYKAANSLFFKRKKKKLKEVTPEEIEQEVAEISNLDFSQQLISAEEYAAVLIAVARKRRLKF